MILRRRKKEEKDEEIKEEEGEKKSRRKKKEVEDEYVWDKKRIIIAAFIILALILAAGELKNRFYPNTNILGESTTKNVSDLEKPEIDSPNLNLGEQVNTSLEEVKESISDIDPEEVASSSPQIQKVLKDIQGIRNLPTDKARSACFRICEGI